MASRDFKYVTVREKLDNLGYNHPLHLDSLALVNALISDLTLYRERFMRHRDIALESVEKCRSLELTIHPLEEERNQLLQQNNYLHHELQQTREHYEKTLKGLRKHMADLENAYSDLEFANMEQMTKIGALEEQILIQNEALLKYEGLPKKTIKNASDVLSLKNALSCDGKIQEKKGPTYLSSIASVNNYISEVLSQKSPHELFKEVENLKAEREKLSESIEHYQAQLKSRDEEIMRLIEQPPKVISSNYSFPSCRCHTLETDSEHIGSADSDIKSKFEGLNMKLQSAVNTTLFLADKVKFLEKKLEQGKKTDQTVQKQNDFVCICREIEKLQDVFHNCKCGRPSVNSHSKSALRMKINELLDMLDGLSKENKDLQKKIEEYENKGVPKEVLLENESLKKCCTDLTNELVALRGEMTDLRQTNLSLKSTIDRSKASEKNVAFKSPTENSGKISSNSSSSLGKKNPKGGIANIPSASKKPASDKSITKSCCLNLRDELMLLQGENDALKQSNLSLQGIIKSFRPLSDSSEAILRTASDGNSSSPSVSKPVKSGGSLKSCIGSNEKKRECSSKETGSEISNFDSMKEAILKEVENLCKKFCPPTEVEFPEIEDRFKAMTAELEKIRAERDYYCKEYHCLQDKLSGNILNKGSIHETEGASARADNLHFQEEMLSLQQKVIELQHSLHRERYVYKMDKLKLEDTIKCLEAEKNKSSSIEEELVSKIQYLEHTADCMNKRVQDIMTESSFLQSQYSNMRTINEHLERSLKNAEVSLQKTEHELNSALQRIKSLEQEKQELLTELSFGRKETQTANDKLLLVVKEKDNLMEALDAQAIEISKLDKEKRQQLCLINMLEQKVSRLNCQAVRSTNEESRAKRDIAHLKKELQLCMEERSKLAAEVSVLHSDLESLLKDNELRNHENENYKREIEKLKEQLQNYVQEVQRVEQILEAKEIEREEVLEQFKTLSAEAMNLESNNQTLESEKKWTSKNLRLAEEKLQDLQATVQNKDSLVSDMEEQIIQLTQEVHFLKDELTNLQMENSRLEQQVETSKEHIKSVDYAKRKYESEVHSLEEQIDKATAGINQSRALKDMLTSQLEEQKNVIATLESAVSSSRKEAVEQSLQNISIQQKVEELQKAIADLQHELSTVNNALWNCQKTCENYRDENIQLKREIVNERFEKVKAEETQSYSTSL